MKSQVALVYNPIKGNQRTLLRQVQIAADIAGRELRLYETSESDSGQGATRQALREGAGVVIAAGGDGTVRAVAEALRGTTVPLAIVPSGTGNLLARNLGLPLNSIDQALRIAFGSTVKQIDLGVVQISRAQSTAPAGEPALQSVGAASEQPIEATLPGEQTVAGNRHTMAQIEEAHPSTEQISTIDLDSKYTSEHVFLVLAGMGLDAHMIKNTHPNLKKRVGWVAYLVGGVRSLVQSQRVRISFIVGKKKKRSHRMHTIMIANCGQLPGGIRFLPEAKIDDGLLDIVLLRPDGLWGWWLVTWQMIWQNGIRRQHIAGKKIRENDNERRTVNYLTGDSVKLLASEPTPVELDGDEFGVAQQMHCWVEHCGLAVMVAEKS